MKGSSNLEGKSGYLRGSNHASNVFGLGNPNLFINNPKTKFEHWVRFNINQADKPKKYFEEYFAAKGNDLNQIQALCKRVQYPNVKMNSSVANQYNQIRHYYTGLSFDPIQIVMHDTADGKTLKFWQMYYTYYFKNGQYKGTKDIFNGNGSIQKINNSNTFSSQSGTISETSQEHDRYGLNVHGANDKLFDSIEIFFQRNRQFHRVVLINPKIVAFNHDTFDYADTTGLMELTFDIEFDNVIYDETVRKIQEVASVKAPDVTTLERGNPNQESSVSNPGPNTHISSEEKKKKPGFLGKLAGSASGIIGTQAQSTLTNIQNQIGSDLVRSLKTSLRTGKLQLNPNPIDTARNIAQGSLDSTKTQLLSSGRKIVTGAAIRGALTIGGSIMAKFNASTNKARQSSDQPPEQPPPEQPPGDT